MNNIGRKTKVIDEMFLTGEMPSYLTPISANRKQVSDGKLKIITLPEVGDREYLRSNFVIDPRHYEVIKLSLIDVSIKPFEDTTCYIGFDGAGDDYWRFQFSDSGSTIKTIRAYAYKDGRTSSFDIGRGVSLDDNSMDFRIEYYPKQGHMDFFVESSRIRINDPDFLPSTPMYMYFEVRDRGETSKTMSIGRYRIELTK